MILLLMEWLEPKVKLQISEMNVDVEIASRVIYRRLMKIINESIERDPGQSKQLMEIEEIFNDMLAVSIDLTYRRGFYDGFKLLKEIV
jgi:hypothetical protein